jgi:hypothetical protein
MLRGAAGLQYIQCRCASCPGPASCVSDLNENSEKGTEIFYGIPVRVLSVASWFHWSGMLLVSYYDHSGCKNATGRYPTMV